MILLLVLIVAREPQWPRVMIRLSNESASPVVVDTRWHDPWLGVDGPVVQTLPRGVTIVVRGPRSGEACVRRIDSESGFIVSARVRPSAARAETVDVRVATSGVIVAGARADPCPEALARHRVRVSPGRYFDPSSPELLRREPILHGLW